MEPVTEVLLDRAREPRGIRTTLGVSVAIHVVAALVLILTPGALGMRAEEMPRTVMTISLGGAPGPQVGGRNPLGGRPIQTIVRCAADAARSPSSRRRPDARDGRAGPGREPLRSVPAGASVRDADEAKAPPVGEQERFSSAVGETAGVGLAGYHRGRRDGRGTGRRQFLLSRLPEHDAADPGELNSASRSLAVMIRFSIQQDGRITDVAVEKSSGYTALDMNAQRALMVTRLPALPSAFPDSVLTVHLIFEYQR
jgi:TonB family protein